MVILPGYLVGDKLYEGKKSLIYRAKRERDGKNVLFKLLKEEYPSLIDIGKLKYEHYISSMLNIEGIVRVLGIEQYNNSPVLILEDFEGKALKSIIANYKIDLQLFLDIAVKLADILISIHKSNVIHKDLNPNNIIVNLKTGEVKITDFEISTILTKENNKTEHFVALEGTLPYISPEQTGRMNITIDYRTDFYSLGISFYEMLSGVLPFTSEDPLELIHSHLAKEPKPLNIQNPAVPEIVSRIVMKLMEKKPEARYQSAIGLKKDLLNCKAQLDAVGQIMPFELGLNDICDNFYIAQRLFGRDSELNSLINSYKKICTGKSELYMITGSSGVGKSTLCKELHKAILDNKGYFIYGKFDQTINSSPYSAIAKAFKGLINKLLSEKKENIDTLKSKLLQVLGNNASIITNVIPELEGIIGLQAPLTALPSLEAQNRFILAFRSFIKALATRKHPIVIFLDNLQWADASSLKLIEAIACDFDIKYILFIGAYRDDEVDASHILTSSIKELEKNKIAVNKLELKPFDLDSVCELLQETFRCDRASIFTLAQICLQKTGGNPFFINQYLYTLYMNNLIMFSAESGRWEYNIDFIRETSSTANVIDLMIRRIETLSSEAKSIIQLAACIGNNFEMHILAKLCSNSPFEVYTNLMELVGVGLIVPADSTYKYLYDNKSASSICFSFFHNRIQQAAYYMLDEDSRLQKHYLIGKFLLEFTRGNTGSEVFSIVNHLNLCVPIIKSTNEILKLAELNLHAGRKAKEQAAYQHAFEYFKTGLDLICENHWHTRYSLCLQLNAEGAEAACTLGQFEAMDTMIDKVLSKAQNILDKVKVYEIRVQALIAKNKLPEAINCSMSALKLLGVRFPKKPNSLNILINITKANAIFDKNINRLSEFPIMTDPYKLAQMRIMSSAGMAAYSALPELVPLFICKSLYLSVNYGNSPQSIVGYLSFGFIQCGVIGNIEKGYNIAKAALKLIENSKELDYKGYCELVFNTLVRHWKEHIKTCLAPLLDAYQIGLSTGDIETSSYSAHNYCSLSYFSGCSLSVLQHEISIQSAAIRKNNHKTALNINELYRQIVINLASASQEPYALEGEYYDERLMLPHHIEFSDINLLFNLYFNKAILFYLFNDIENADKFIKLSEKYLYGVIGNYTYPLFYFYESLIMFAKGDINKKLKLNMKKLKKWSKHSQANYLNKYYLLKAEYYRAANQTINAMNFYDMAVAAAKESGFIQEQGLANELAANYFLSLEKTKIAQTYAKDAHFCYLNWGAMGKVQAIEEKYSNTLSTSLAKKEITASYINSNALSTTATLDVSTIVKAAQALSGEILLEELLKKLIIIILENSGAQNAFFLMKIDNELVIEAEGSIKDNKIAVMHSYPLEDCNRLSEGIVNYVARTKDAILLDNACEAAQFHNDLYIINNQPKSVLCTPIINSGRLLGILYLENNLLSGAFSQERLELLNILCSQVSISIENASLYNNLQNHKAHLEELVSNRTKELTEANLKLQKTTANIKNLLNNAGQGFLSFGRDMLINDNYSTECTRIFGIEMLNMTFPKLIYPHNSEQENTLKEIIKCVFSEQDPIKRNVFLSLLPDELLVKNRYINIEYKLILGNLEKGENIIIMLIITDITSKRSLEKQMEEEKGILKMVVKVVANNNDFIDCIKDYEHFCKYKLNEILDSNSSINYIISDIYRNVHNFKGVFSQFDFKETVAKLHGFETELAAIKYSGDITLKDLRQLIYQNQMYRWIEKDLLTIKDILGQQFFDHSSLFGIEKSKLIELEKKALSLLSPLESKLFLPHLRRLRFQPFKELLRSYPDYVMRLSENLNKSVLPVTINGGEMLVDIDRYSAFTKTLVHIFRNCLDHGIEYPDVRIDSGKLEYGKINCNIYTSSDNIRLVISDDGCGIDASRLKALALEKGFISRYEGDMLSDEDAMRLLFLEGFTTKNSPDELSGRGIGLSSVIKELDKLGGTASINTKLGFGTELSFIIPNISELETPLISSETFTKMLLEIINKFLYQSVGISSDNVSKNLDSGLSEIKLCNYTVVINIKGTLSGKVILSADEGLGKYILDSFTLSSAVYEKTEEAQYIKDVLGECLNTVLGNLLKRLNDLQQLVMIDPPASIQASAGTLKYSQAEICSYEINFDAGKLLLCFVRNGAGF